jgi:nuclear pore complex protein Nup62
VNKNMEDLITKWTNQLSLSSNTFEKYSEKIGEWDSVLVNSSEKVSRLYNDTIQCEQKQEKIDQTLAYIEKQQDELDALLTGYEKQSDRLLSSIEKSSSSGNPLIDINNKETNDEAREKAYKLAEMLENRLDSLGANFSSLVNEVNDVSDNFNKSLLNADASTEGEQTLNDVFKLLNNHMESLSWISENEKLLKEKLEKLTNFKQ